MRKRIALITVLLALFALALFVFFSFRVSQAVPTPAANGPAVRDVAATRAANQNENSSIRIHAHNLLLRKGDNFQVYVRWLNGTLERTRRDVNPSFDDPESFVLNIHTGIIRANIGDAASFLNSGLANSPLRSVKLQADGDQIKLTGTVKKVIPLPVEVRASVAATSDNRIRVHIEKINVLKVPVKALLGGLKVSLADFVNQKIEGLEIVGNDAFLDTVKLMPPPHIHGRLTTVRVDSPDIEEVFGDASGAASREAEKVEMWRNFLSLKGGTLDFGKLTMKSVDLMMIDISKNPWFDLDLVHYQDQLTNGYTRVTPEAGLQIFMPDRRDITPAKQSSDIQWFKNRNIPPPPQVTPGR